MKPFEERGHAILKRLPFNAIAAEVGVLIGQLSEYLLAQRQDLQLLMVDNWLTTDQQPEAYRATGDDHALHADSARVRSHRQQAEARAKRFGARAAIMPMASVEAASRLEDGMLDLVFIDADHSYEGVKADIAAWLPKIKGGGWIGGHDYRNPDPRFRFGVDRAVDEAFGSRVETDANFTWWVSV
ncbi:MAG: class I SAM-dependent methyltransferase [Rhizobium sp.]|nr:MAG: class I SAM-dependent methyltransferase [Rhizobium sp.]